MPRKARVVLAAFATFVVIVAIIALAAAFVLYSAHRQITELAPPIPSIAETVVAGDDADLPIRVSWINTATQAMPRAVVLEPTFDPSPNDRYVMSHPAFVFEWADGRRFLFDVGMTPEGAESFGKPIELLMGAAPMRPIGAVADQLGTAAASVRGIAFSHLHEDHVGGLATLCQAVGHPVNVFQQALQAEHTNYLTSAGAAMIASAGCSERVRVGDAGKLEGFPGLRLISVGGHTPCSQILVARVRDSNGITTWILTGDVVNNIDGIRKNLPKPAFYSRFVVPESTPQLDLVRRWLKAAEDAGVKLAVNHDQLELEASGMPQG